MMDLADYQRETARFAVYPADTTVVYPMIGLANEAGEALGKLKKVMRGDKTLAEQRESIADELGDVLWYLCRVSTELGYTLEDIASVNHAKLTRRAANGTIMGDGDKR
jgi:NTP pyrophosphatase (non-canonical NTP hydrolase)